MKSGFEAMEPDAIDLRIIDALQEHGRIPHAKLAEQVGLSAPSVIGSGQDYSAGGGAAMQEIADWLKTLGLSEYAARLTGTAMMRKP